MHLLHILNFALLSGKHDRVGHASVLCKCIFRYTVDNRPQLPLCINKVYGPDPRPCNGNQWYLRSEALTQQVWYIVSFVKLSWRRRGEWPSVCFGAMSRPTVWTLVFVGISIYSDVENLSTVIFTVLLTTKLILREIYPKLYVFFFIKGSPCHKSILAVKSFQEGKKVV